MRILVVDDNRDGADTLAMVLRSWEYEVLVAYSGPSALDAVSSFAPDAILLDISMPAMNGYEVTRRLRRDKYVLCIVAITAHGTAAAKQAAFRAGVDHHLIKPVELSELHHVLDKCFAAVSDAVRDAAR